GVLAPAFSAGGAVSSIPSRCQECPPHKEGGESPVPHGIPWFPRRRHPPTPPHTANPTPAPRRSIPAPVATWSGTSLRRECRRRHAARDPASSFPASTAASPGWYSLLLPPDAGSPPPGNWPSCP